MTDSAERGFRLTQQAIRRQLTAMPHDLYRVRLIHNQSRRPLPGQRLWTAAELLYPANIKFLRIRNREGFDVYLHPDDWDQNAGYILLDLDRADGGVLHRLWENGHDPCVVLESESRPPASLDSRDRLAPGALHCHRYGSPVSPPVPRRSG